MRSARQRGNGSLALRAVFAAALVAAAACRPEPAVPPVPLPQAVSVPAPVAGLPGSVAVAFSFAPDEGPFRFFEQPWPSELRRAASARPDFSSYPGRDHFLLGRLVVDADDEIDGFPVNANLYFRFTGPLEPSRLPGPAETLAAGSSIFLVPVDPETGALGARVPLAHRYYPDDLGYVPAHTLALVPVGGHVLRERTLYAAVVLRTLGDTAGAPLGTSRDFETLKWTAPVESAPEEAARMLHAPVFAALEAAGFARADIAAVAVFRTAASVTRTARLFEVASHLEARILSAEWQSTSADYAVVRGYYCTPNFQSGLRDAPFEDEGGTILRRDGEPLVAPISPESEYYAEECGGAMRARYVVSVPRGAMPPRGWPLVVTAHGTTGDAFSFVGSNDFSGWAGRQGAAAASTDQPLHGGRDLRGARPGSNKPYAFTLLGVPIPLPVEGHGGETAFYNPFRPAVLRDNLGQAIADEVILARLLLGTDFGARRADGTSLLSPDGDFAPPRFDGEHLLYAGHSQGSQSIAIVGALDPLARGVILSGAGGDARVHVARRKDVKARAFLEQAVGAVPGEIDEFHPLLALLEAYLDPVDALTFADEYAAPPPGRSPRSVLLFEGLNDSMTDQETAECLAVALRAQPLAPRLRQAPGLELLGIEPAERVHGNAAGGGVTLALVQLAPTRGDGHFVLYYEPAGGLLFEQFVRALVHGSGAPTVGPLP